MGALRLKTDKLVIGYSLESLQFANTQRAMLVVNSTQRPHPQDAPAALRAWGTISFRLGLDGLLPIPSGVEKIRIDGSCAIVTTEYYRVLRIQFNELYIFDLELVEGLAIEEKIDKYVAYDWFDIKRGAKQPPCKILGPSSFLNQIVFYPSLRCDGNSRDLKDCYSKSYIEVADLDTFEKSETAAFLGVAAAIKRSPLKGPTRTVDNKEHYLSLVLEHDRRELYKTQKKFVVSDEVPSNIFCCNVVP